MAVQQRATERAVVAGLSDENITCVSLTATGTIRAGAASSIGFTGRSILTSSADAVLAARNAADNADSAFSCAALTASGSITGTQGTITTDLNALGLTTTWNNAGVTFTGMKLNVTATASNSASLFMDLQLASVTKFNVRASDGKLTAAGSGNFGGATSNGSISQSGAGYFSARDTGRFGWTADSNSQNALDTYIARESANFIGSPGSLRVMNATAIPAGGTAGAGYKFSSTANFGIFFGSGAPSLAAAKGSLYLRSDGSGVADRAYINTDGSTTWSAITTVG